MAKGDSPADLLRLLSATSGGGRQWLVQAEKMIREELWLGRWEKAVQKARVVAAARLAVVPPGNEPSRHDREAYLECMARLRQGIRLACEKEKTAESVGPLTAVATNIHCDGALRWLAWTWLTAVTGISGDLPGAKTAAATARTIAGQLDEQARAMSQAVRAGVGFLRGGFQRPRSRLLHAVQLLESAGYQKETSGLWFTFAKILLDAGRERQGLQVLNQAVEADPAWAAPAILLARRALMAGRVEEGFQVLKNAADASADSEELQREVALVEAVRQGQIPLATVTEAFWLRERPLSSEVVAELVEFLDEQSSCAVLKLVMGWDLLLFGYRSEASEILGRLSASEEISLEVHFSAQQGRRAGQEPVARDISPLQLIQEQGDFGLLREDSEKAKALPDSGIYWARRAIMKGRMEEADKILQGMDAVALNRQELDRERRLLDSILQGRTPQAVVTEYLWLQERPLTETVVDQIESFAEENPGFWILREVMAWDLALGGFFPAAARCFRRLGEEMDLDEQTQQSIRRGLAFLRESNAGAVGTNEFASREISNPSILARYVTRRQVWPSVLDQHSLLFVGQTEEIAPEVLSWTEALSLPEGDYVQRQGHPGWLLTFIDQGAAFARRKRGQSENLGLIQQKCFWGEVGTIGGLPNTTEVVAAEPTTARLLNREEVLRQVRAGNKTATVLLHTLRGWYLDVVMKICPVFASMSQEDRAELTVDSRSEIFHSGEALANQGEPAALCVIVSGIARVEIKVGRNRKTLGHLCPGDVVGDIDPSPVTVLAESTVTALTVNRRRLEELPAQSREDLARRSRLVQRIITDVQAGRTPIGI